MYYQEAIERKEKAEYIAALLNVEVEEVVQIEEECKYYGIDILENK